MIWLASTSYRAVDDWTSAGTSRVYQMSAECYTTKSTSNQVHQDSMWEQHSSSLKCRFPDVQRVMGPPTCDNEACVRADAGRLDLQDTRYTQ
jgi:hypothetical protein